MPPVFDKQDDLIEVTGETSCSAITFDAGSNLLVVDPNSEAEFAIGDLCDVSVTLSDKFDSRSYSFQIVP